MTIETLARQLAVLAVVFPKDVTPELVEVYRLALADLTDDELTRAVAVIVQQERFFPTPAVLREYARPVDVGQTAIALTRVLRLEEYTPRGGPTWRVSRIRAEVSEAAARAFQAAGGSPAFALLDDPFHGPGVRRAFMEAFTDTVRREPQTLQPGAPVSALPASLRQRIGRGGA